VCDLLVTVSKLDFGNGRFANQKQECFGKLRDFSVPDVATNNVSDAKNRHHGVEHKSSLSSTLLYAVASSKFVRRYVAVFSNTTDPWLDETESFVLKYVYLAQWFPNWG